MSHIYREQTPLSQNGLYFAKNTPHDPAEFSLHYHDEFELTLVLGVNGKRIVGNVVDDFENRDLVLVCPNALHDYTWNPEFTDADVTVLQTGYVRMRVDSVAAGAFSFKSHLQLIVNVPSGTDAQATKATIVKINEITETLHSEELLVSCRLGVNAVDNDKDDDNNNNNNNHQSQRY